MLILQIKFLKYLGSIEALMENTFNVLIGSGCSGKSSIAKQLFYLEETTESESNDVVEEEVSHTT